MHDLYLSENPFQSSNVDPKDDTSVNDSAIEINTMSATLGLDKPRSVENLGKVDVNLTVDDTIVAEASTKADVHPTVDPVQKVV
ncbi:hypothetical protein A2U01_0055523, partial [Trifolium medium]|nr:hypothetical protein [Trifolium medium]